MSRDIATNDAVGEVGNAYLGGNGGGGAGRDGGGQGISSLISASE